MRIAVTRTSTPKAKLPDAEIGFGKTFTDHMLLIDYAAGQGWHGARVVPYAPLAMDPACAALHYGQTMFEGMKAFRGKDDVVRVFALEQHLSRMSRSAPRLAMPSLDVGLMAEGLLELVRVDQDWVPRAPGTSMYIRPTLIASEAYLGVRPSQKYLFFVIMTPVGPYYGAPGSDPLVPVAIRVETHYTRAAPGGVGAVKAGGNYAASLLAAEEAKRDGYAQVLWTDVSHQRIEEIGTMNVFLRFGDELVTPPLSDSILAGVTRASILSLAGKLGLRVAERPVTLDEIVAGQASGHLREVFGTGTASVVVAVGELEVRGQRLKIGSGGVGEVTRLLYDRLAGIRDGTQPDTEGWLTAV